MKINQYYIRSSDHQIDLSICEYVSNAPKGIIIITHGMSEYKNRYYNFAKFLCENDYHTIIHDLRGHGDSVLFEEDYGYFYDNNGEAVVEDLHLIVEATRKKFPNLPCYLFSHSMGTLITQCFLKEYDNTIQGVIFCGQPCKKALAIPGLLLAKLIKIIKGEHYRSNLLQNLTITSYDKQIKGDTLNRWLSRDEHVVNAYNNDIKCGFIFTTNGFINLLSLMNKAYKKNYKMKNIHLPITFMAGSKDPVIGGEKKFYKESAFLEKLGYKDIQSILYDDLYHEILNELEYLQVYGDILYIFNSMRKSNP